MNLRLVRIAGILLILLSLLIIITNLVENFGTDCFNMRQMILSIFCLIYSVFLRII